MFLEWKPIPEQMEIMIEDAHLIDSGTLDQAIQSVKQEKNERREQRCQMAYSGVFRTNYFRIKDKEEFWDFVSNVLKLNVDLYIRDKEDDDGNTLVSFVAYQEVSEIKGGVDSISFFTELQKYIAPGDAAIFFEIGNDLLEWFESKALIVTPDSFKWLDLLECAVEEAAKLISNPSWTTEYRY